MSRLERLLALANRPGTGAEGDAARAAAARRAPQEGVRLVELGNGTLIAAEPLDEMRADLMRALHRAAGDDTRGELDG